MVAIQSSGGKRRPSVVVVLLVAVLFLAAIWSALWLFLSGRANIAIDGWLAAENAAGRQWTCPGRHVGGYPWGVSLHCDRPTFRGEVAGRTADGSVESLEAGVRLDRPRRVGVTLHGPLILRSEAEDFALTASWSDMTLGLDNAGSRSMRGSLDATRLAVTLETVGRGDLNLRAAAASGEATPTAAPGAAAFGLTATGLVFPTLDALPGFEQPTDLEARGVLTRADLLQAPTRARLEAWRAAGGALQLSSLTVSKGAFHGAATGELALDDAHRATGRLDTTLSGFEPIAARYGIPLAGVQLGGLLSTLLGGGKAPPAEAGSVRLPLTLAGGAVVVGPFRTGVRLDPLY